MEVQIQIQIGIPETFREDASQLYDQAFGEKFQLAVQSTEERLKLLSSAFNLSHAIAAIHGDMLAGIAGFSTKDGCLTDGITFKHLLRHLGFLRGIRAAMVFSLYERHPNPRELLMDGIAVRQGMRGSGIGSGLLTALKDYAVKNCYEAIRLDVIDTNSSARRLYERHGFIPTKTESVGFLGRFLGFSRSTTMVYRLETTDQPCDLSP